MLGGVVNLQHKPRRDTKALQAQVPKSYSQTRSLRARCKNDTADAIGESWIRASLAVNINSRPRQPTSTVPSALMEIGSPLFAVSRMMFSTRYSPIAPLEAVAQGFPFQPSPLDFLQEDLRIFRMGAQATTAVVI